MKIFTELPFGNERILYHTYMVKPSCKLGTCDRVVIWKLNENFVRLIDKVYEFLIRICTCLSALILKRIAIGWCSINNKEKFCHEFPPKRDYRIHYMKWLSLLYFHERVVVIIVVGWGRGRGNVSHCLCPWPCGAFRGRPSSSSRQ